MRRVLVEIARQLRVANLLAFAALHPRTEVGQRALLDAETELGL